MEENINRPLVTLALFAYNQEAFIEEAILGAFAQTYSPLQIILSDDCSPDRTFEIMEKMAKDYQGAHHITLNCNKKNLGLIQHVNKVFKELANSEIIVVAAGDDISLPNRVEETWKVFNKDSTIMSVSSNYNHINYKGSLINKRTNFKEGLYTLEDYIATSYFPIHGCARAYRKEVFNFFDPLKKESAVEDATTVFRAMLLGNLYTIKECLLNYRVGINSMSKDIDVNVLNNVINQRMTDSLLAKKKKKINEEFFTKLIIIFASAGKKNEKLKKLQDKKSIIYFLRNIYFDSNFHKNDKRTLLKSLIKNKINK